MFFDPNVQAKMKESADAVRAVAVAAYDLRLEQELAALLAKAHASAEG